MNDDKSFIELTRYDNLSKIQIDSRLIPVFTNVMQRIQAYFNEHNYTKNYNYHNLIEQEILSNKNSKKLCIKCYNTGNSINGFYDLKNKLIVVNERLLYESSKNCEHTLCHEFIHFLVSVVFKKRIFANKNIKEARSSGFIGEAFTEMLTLRIYPESIKKSGYSANVKLMEFYNTLSDNINQFQVFLHGKLQFKIVDWYKKPPEIQRKENEFIEWTNKYMDDCYATGTPFAIQLAHESESYCNAQRCLVEGFLKTVDNLDKYLNILEKLANLPVLDNYFMNNILSNKEYELIRNLNINDEEYFKCLMRDINALRNDILNFYSKNCILPYNGGVIYMFDNLEYINYGKGRIRAVDKIFLNGIYRYYYNIDGISYEFTIDKVNEYQLMEYYKNLFYGHLNYIKNYQNIEQSNHNLK